jgi:hypothetical protein
MTDNGSSANAGRSERLRVAVSKLRSRSGGGGGMERYLLIAGAIMVIVGVPVIVLGWYGASRTPYVFEQVPYLISGGLLGLALAVLGGLFYFAYWVTKQIQETRRQTEQTGKALSEIRDLLAGATIAASGASAGKARATGNGAFVATENGTMFHRPDCVVVQGRDDLRKVEPGAKGLEPCKICEPLAVS